MILAPALMMVVAFTFATAIFHTLLGVERRIWRLGVPQDDVTRVSVDEIRFTHRMLKHLIKTDVGIVRDSTDLVPVLEAALADLAIAMTNDLDRP